MGCAEGPGRILSGQEGGHAEGLKVGSGRVRAPELERDVPALWVVGLASKITLFSFSHPKTLLREMCFESEVEMRVGIKETN